jgi:muconate cycloisomerase
MKIERIEIHGVDMPLMGAFKTAYHSSAVQRSIIVRITSDDGLTGLGNVDPIAGYSEETPEQTLDALVRRFAPALLGSDAGNIHQAVRLMDALGPGFLDAKAALEMACIDLQARSLGIPVHQLLGGLVTPEVRLNAWIGILPPEQAAHEALGWKKQGFRSAKVKVGGDIHADRDRVRAIREAVGDDFEIRADANAGYDVDTAIALARLLEPYRLQLLEQPVPAHDISGLAAVRTQCPGIPIMADESILDHASLIRVIEARAADIVKVKVMKQGGMLSTRRMIETAAAAGIRCVVGHGFGLGINTMAEIMMAATSDNVIDGLECVGPLKTADDVVRNKLDMRAGSVLVPNQPGLSVELDETRLARYGFARFDIH